MPSLPQQEDSERVSRINMWKERILEASKDTTGVSMHMLTAVLIEQDEAKQILRDKGYGWTGLSLLETVIFELPDIN